MRTKISCIYKIINPKGKIYIGQTTDVYGRLWKYRNLHCKNQPKLYESLRKYGWPSHQFEVIEECKMEDLNEKEIRYIKEFKSIERELGLNLKEGGNSGGRLSEEVKEKIRQKAIGRKVSEETRSKMRKAKENWIWSDEHRKNHAAAIKCIKVYTIIDGVKMEFPSIAKAARETGCSPHSIGNQIKGLVGYTTNSYKFYKIS